MRVHTSFAASLMLKSLSAALFLATFLVMAQGQRDSTRQANAPVTGVTPLGDTYCCNGTFLQCNGAMPSCAPPGDTHRNQVAAAQSEYVSIPLTLVAGQWVDCVHDLSAVVQDVEAGVEITRDLQSISQIPDRQARAVQEDWARNKVAAYRSQASKEFSSAVACIDAADHKPHDSQGNDTERKTGQESFPTTFQLPVPTERTRIEGLQGYQTVTPVEKSLPSPFSPVKRLSPPPITEEYYRQAGVAHRQGDYAIEFEWDTKAAELGHPKAQNDLGFLYANGFGVARPDYTKALYWWGKSAEQGDAVAERSLALMYSRGLAGLPQNYLRVADWLARAAEHGNVQAMFEYGRLLSQPIQFPMPDKNGALHWLDEAARRGHTNAAQLKAELTRQWAAEQATESASEAPNETPLQTAERVCREKRYLWTRTGDE